MCQIISSILPLRLLAFSTQTKPYRGFCTLGTDIGVQERCQAGTVRQAVLLPADKPTESSVLQGSVARLSTLSEALHCCRGPILSPGTRSLTQMNNHTPYRHVAQSIAGLQRFLGTQRAALRLEWLSMNVHQRVNVGRKVQRGGKRAFSRLERMMKVKVMDLIGLSCTHCNFPGGLLLTDCALQPQGLHLSYIQLYRTCHTEPRPSRVICTHLSGLRCLPAVQEPKYFHKYRTHFNFHWIFCVSVARHRKLKCLRAKKMHHRGHAGTPPPNYSSTNV